MIYFYRIVALGRFLLDTCVSLAPTSNFSLLGLVPIFVRDFSAFVSVARNKQNRSTKCHKQKVTIASIEFRNKLYFNKPTF